MVYDERLRKKKSNVEQKKASDPTNPDHYKNGGIETWDVIEAWLGSTKFLGYLEGNVIKYVSRWEEKNGLEDLKKARVYLDKMISKLEPESVKAVIPEVIFDNPDDAKSFNDGVRQKLPEEIEAETWWCLNCDNYCKCECHGSKTNSCITCKFETGKAPGNWTPLLGEKTHD